MAVNPSSSNRRERKYSNNVRHLLRLRRSMLDILQTHETELFRGMGFEPGDKKSPIGIYSHLWNLLTNRRRKHLRQCSYCRDGLQAANLRAMPCDEDMAPF